MVWLRRRYWLGRLDLPIFITSPIAQVTFLKADCHISIPSLLDADRSSSQARPNVGPLDDVLPSFPLEGVIGLNLARFHVTQDRLKMAWKNYGAMQIRKKQLARSAMAAPPFQGL
jgi:hypothetical protein